MPVRGVLSRIEFFASSPVDFTYIITVTVSYTHLDVYKRQAYRTQNCWALLDKRDFQSALMLMIEFAYTYICLLYTSIVLSHIKVNRGAVQHIAVGGLDCDQGISRAVFQLFRRYQIALGIGVEDVYKRQAISSSG